MVSVFFTRVQTCGIYSMDSLLERAMESSEEWLENVLRELDLCRQKLLQELSMCGITPKQVEERKAQGEKIDDASVAPFHKVLEELASCRERIRTSMEDPVLPIPVSRYVGECDMGVQQQCPTNILGRHETGCSDCETTCEILNKPSNREINLSVTTNLPDMDNLIEMNSSNNEEEKGEGVKRDEDLPDIVKQVLAELASCRENIKAAMNVHAVSGTEDEQVGEPYDVALDGDCSVEKVWQEFKDCRVKIRETLRNEFGEERGLGWQGQVMKRNENKQ